MNADRLTRWDRLGLAMAGVLVLAFAGLTELRACYLKARMTDAGVYFRAAWAVRSGADLYRVTDDNGWHYIYPPAFAVLMAPLADAPAGEPRDGLLPYPVSIAVWMLVNLLLVGRMAHVLASLLLPGAVPGSRRWWYARSIPIILTLGGLGFTIGHGQVNVLVAALIVEMFRATEHGRRFTGGLWLAAAITIKVIPAFLLLYPLLRRDGRALAGTAAGLVVGLGVIPLVALGLERTEAAYASFVDRVLLPGATGASNPDLGQELTDVKATDSQSFLSVIHNNLHPDRVTQPFTPATGTQIAHALLAASLTLIVVVTGRRAKTREDRLIVLGLLMLLMLHSTPVSHMHYYALGYPLLAGLWLKGLAARQGAAWPGGRAAWPLVGWALATALPLLQGPEFETLRHRGLGLGASVLLGTVALRRIRLIGESSVDGLMSWRVCVDAARSEKLRARTPRWPRPARPDSGRWSGRASSSSAS